MRRRIAALLHAVDKAMASGARPSSAASGRRPAVQQFQSHKPVARTFTGWVRARMPALLHAVEKATALGSAAVLGRINPTTGCATVSITQARRTNIHRLGAAKNRRAPARGGKLNRVGSAAVLGRINPMTDRSTRFDQANLTTEHTPAGCGEESPRSCTRWTKQWHRERGRPRPPHICDYFICL